MKRITFFKALIVASVLSAASNWTFAQSSPQVLPDSVMKNTSTVVKTDLNAAKATTKTKKLTKQQRITRHHGKTNRHTHHLKSSGCAQVVQPVCSKPE